MSNHPSVVIYTSQKNAESVELKQFLRDNSIEFRDRGIDTDYEAREHMNNVLKANNITPVVVIGNKPFVGFKRNLKSIKKELEIK